MNSSSPSKNLLILVVKDRISNDFSSITYIKLYMIVELNRQDKTNNLASLF
jgi:hypothetical protein